MIITSGTIGYGDIFPVEVISRMVIVLIIVALITIFGNFISGMSNVIMEADSYNTYYHLKNHIIIIGNLNPNILLRFLTNFYNGLPNERILPKTLIVGE